MNNVIMKCGHAANAKSNGQPCCVICCNIVEGWNIVDTAPDTAQNIEARKAVCAYCGSTRDSAPSLTFFQWRKDKATDSYYCGCRGWD